MGRQANISVAKAGESGAMIWATLLIPRCSSLGPYCHLASLSTEAVEQDARCLYELLSLWPEKQDKQRYTQFDVLKVLVVT